MLKYLVDKPHIRLNRRHDYYPSLDLVYQHSSEEFVYADNYWEAYRARKGTAIERHLNEARARMASPGRCVFDVGVGNMSFLEFFNEKYGKCYGYDINPIARRALLEKGIYCDLTNVPEEVDTWCCHDVLEHFGDPREILDLIPVNKSLCVCIPIFTDLMKVEHSKHYKENEHRIYFGHEGFLKYMDYAGFSCVSTNNQETIIGRESIQSYKFIKSHSTIC